ncbi:tetratricopeptide repeat protein [Saccharopolyspora sp. NPDC002686]|uniref:tetratricopeptide repeat protein n=1 Tax=Saccharopolyspora sp. NPDC002686 TaxID=3154541 RepID=UPI00332FAE77
MTGHDVGGNHFDGESENVVQARDIHGDVHFHAPKSPRPSPNQVPPPTKFFTNNERQLKDTSKYLRPDEEAEHQAPKVVVLEGAPGSGKSETAHQWVHQHRAAFPDGAFYAPLEAGTDETGLVGEALLQCLLGVGYSPEEIPADLGGRSNLWRSWTTGKRLVLVVNGAVTAAQVLPLLPGAGNSAVLVTAARSLISLRARAGAEFVPLEPLSKESARKLLCRIVGDARDLADEPGPVDELIERCAGQTIALCVAGSELAGRPERPVARLVRELSNERRRLAALSRDHDLSVEAVFNTAVGRLDEQARLVYEAFGQHPGVGEVGSVALAEAVRLDEFDLQDALDQLVSAHLIREVGDDRYSAHALVRDHARLLAGAITEVNDRFIAFYVRRALSAGHAVQPKRGWMEALWPGFQPEPIGPDEAWAWLEAERVNVQAVAGELHAAGSELVCQLAVALWPFQEQGKHVDDMDVINRHAVEVATHRELTFAAGLALIQRGFAFRARGESDKAAELFAGGEEKARAVERDDLTATAVESLGISLRDQGDRGGARPVLERNLVMAERLDDPRRLALARMHLGSVAEPQRGEELLNQALAAFASEPYNAAKTRMWRGRRRTELARYDDANADLRAALEYMTEHGKHFDRAQVLVGLGDNALAAGDGEAAREHFLGAAAVCRTRGFAELGEQVQVRLDQS